MTNNKAQEAPPLADLSEERFRRDVVVVLTQDRSAPTRHRVCALEVLYDHRELLARAVENRLSMLIEPEEVQRCLRVAKRRLKE